MFFDVYVQIYTDLDGGLVYSVSQCTSETDGSNETIAYGEAESLNQALSLAREAVLSLFEVAP